MPSVWFINPRIVANLKALATREKEKARERKSEPGKKREEEQAKTGGGREGENLLKISGVESTVGKVDEERTERKRRMMEKEKERRRRGERWMFKEWEREDGGRA